MLILFIGNIWMIQVKDFQPFLWSLVMFKVVGDELLELVNHAP